MLNRAAGAEQGARNLPELRQRRVALERVCRGARVTELVERHAVARSGGSEMLNRAASTKLGASDLLERRQRRVALERVCRGARVTELVLVQAVARRGGSAMLVARQGR
jgi:hypothetical protein